jgi:PTH1 family peptidyl-tRNA hydrolase
MGLFQKNQESYIGSSLFTLGLNKSLLIVGLGNVGKEYDNTRHNIGFKCIDEFVAAQPEFPKWTDSKNLKCYSTHANLGESRVVIIKPTTLMNLSGEAVNLVANFYKIPPSQVLVIYDELDIEFGKIRGSVGGSSAGHNGVKSVIQHIDKNFNRIRIGIGPKTPPQIDSADFVLSKFNKEQSEEISALTKEVNSYMTEFIYSGKLPEETRSFLI